jgi:tRNA pseudouridine38-40 synthase
MSERNIRLLMAYDGTRYQGWQRQKEAPTIQGTIETVLRRVTQEPLHLLGAGRTDAGVHAWGQTANFNTGTKLSLHKLESALTALLPGDILIRLVEEADPTFHARYSSTAKVYDYYFIRQDRPNPFLRHYVWSIREPLSLPLMRAGLSLLEGQKDFSSFQTAGTPVAHAVRTLFQADLLPAPWGGWRFRFRADGFLRHMVRNMTGLLIRVGLGRVSPEEFQAIVQAKDRSRAGEMAPPQGLFLRKVFYSKN